MPGITLLWLPLLVISQMSLAANMNFVSISFYSPGRITQNAPLQTIINNCSETIWPAYNGAWSPSLLSENRDTVDKSGGWEAPAGSRTQLSLPEYWRGWFCTFLSGVSRLPVSEVISHAV